MSDIYLSLTETPSVVTLSQPVIASSVAATVTVGNTVTVALDANSLSALENVTVTVGAAVSVSNFPASQVISGTVTANPTGTQTIAGTVTANVDYASQELSTPNKATQIGYKNTAPDFVFVEEGTNNFPVKIFTSDGVVGGGNASVPISGTVTANGGDFSSSTTMPPHKAVNLGFTNGDGEFLQVGDQYPLPVGSYDQRLATCGSGNSGVEVPNNTPNLRIVGGFVSASVTIPSFNIYKAILVDSSGRSVVTGSVGISNSVTIGSLPSGALTTRFGSVTTASVAQITSAVTNTSRKYLLAQNISAGTVTIGIGFSPTTTQGIQLPAGGGLTFDAFCPTGAVYWLGAVTGAAFTILEG